MFACLPIYCNFLASPLVDVYHSVVFNILGIFLHYRSNFFLLLLTKAELIWSKYNKNSNIVNYYYNLQ